MTGSVTVGGAGCRRRRRRPTPGGRRAAGRRTRQRRPGGVLPSVIGRAAVRRARGPPGRRGAGAVECHAHRGRTGPLIDDCRARTGDHRRRSPGHTGRRPAGRARRPIRWPGPCITPRAPPDGRKGCGRVCGTPSTAEAAFARRSRPVVLRARRRPPGLLAHVPLGLDPVRRRDAAPGRRLRHPQPIRRRPWPLGRDAGRRRPGTHHHLHGSGRTRPPARPRRRRRPRHFGALRLLVHAGSPCPPGSKRRALDGWDPACCGSSTAPPKDSSRCAPPTSGWPGRGPSVGPGRGRTLRCDDDGTIWCLAPRLRPVQLLGGRGQDRGGLAGRLFHRRRSGTTG